MKRRIGIMLIAFALLAVSLAWAAEWQEKRATAAIGQDGVQRIEILAGGYYYDPNTVVVKVNLPVEADRQEDARRLRP